MPHAFAAGLIPAVAPPRIPAAVLAAERVTTKELTALATKTDAYRPLVGTPRGQILAGSALRTTARKLVGQLRTAFEPIDTRMDSLGEEEEFAAMAAEVPQGAAAGERGARPCRGTRGPLSPARRPQKRAVRAHFLAKGYW